MRLVADCYTSFTFTSDLYIYSVACPSVNVILTTLQKQPNRLMCHLECGLAGGQYEPCVCWSSDPLLVGEMILGYAQTCQRSIFSNLFVRGFGSSDAAFDYQSSVAVRVVRTTILSIFGVLFLFVGKTRFRVYMAKLPRSCSLIRTYRTAT